MRILHIVPFASSDGAFGGPLTVARNQCTELTNRGHAVTLLAAHRKHDRPADVGHGFSFLSFPVTAQSNRLGFSGLFSAELYAHVRRSARNYDLVHVHTGRHVSSLGAILIAQKTQTPVIAQTHGMLPEADSWTTKAFDRMITRRVLTNTRRILVLTALERRQIQALVGPAASLELVRNGVPPLASVATIYHRNRTSPDVLFCARLHERKRPTYFVRMAARLTKLHPSARFSIIGPDEGALADVQSEILRLGLKDRVSYEGALPHDAVLDRLRRADVYVLPSINEPFPMSLLEALSCGLPSVCTDSTGISAELKEAKAAVVTNGTVADLTNAVDRVLRDPELATTLRNNALNIVKARYSIRAIAAQLEEIYSTEISRFVSNTSAELAVD